jgi:hypothetical protein
MHTRQSAFGTGLLFVLILLAGCVPYSDHPLTAPSAAIDDPDLIGNWYADDDGKRNLIRISRGKAPGQVRVLLEEEDETEPADLSKLSGHLGEIAGKRYMNLRSDDPDDDVPGFIFVRYAIAEGRLGIAISDPTKLEQAIESGKLEGEIIKGKWYSTAHITAGTAALAEFVAGNDAEIFMETLYLQPLEDKAASSGND